MKLVRLVSINFNPPVQEKWKTAVFDNSAIKIQMFPVTVNKEPNSNLIICEAEITLSSLPLLVDNHIQIPESPRRELEQSIEDVSNMISVSEMAQRAISSIHPCVGFRPETKDELDWLNQTNGIQYTLKAIPSFRFTLADEMNKANFLQDRLDGVALMAEALANLHPSGRLHELMRVFENAFSSSSESLVTLLVKFLDSSPFEFDKKDIKYMIKKLRDRLTHADKTRVVLLESDIRHYIYKMEEIAYDVLFNKAEWHNSSPMRRDILKPKAGVKNDGTAFTYQNNSGFDQIMQFLDPFGSYPLNLKGILTGNVTKLWFKKSGDPKSMVTESYPFHVESK